MIRPALIPSCRNRTPCRRRPTVGRSAAALLFFILLLSVPPFAADGAEPPTHATNSVSAALKPPSSLRLTLQANHYAPARQLDDKYLLTIGDRLSFRILEDEDDPRPLLVTDSGDLEVPYVGRVPAAGLTCKKLAATLKTALERDYYYHATVVIAVDSMTRSRGKVYLVGPVRAPGPVEVTSDEVLTRSKAILRAGGFTDYADQRHVKVTRKNVRDGAAEQSFTVNVEEILERGKTGHDLPLQAGDLIYVPERLIRF
jgi:hypothetical protein